VTKAGSKKLTPEQELQIRHSYEYEGATQAGLARRFGVSNKVIRRVLGLPNNGHKESPKSSVYYRPRTAAETEAWQDFMARRHEIPKGPVSWNQKLLGDPLPGRSALDRRQEA
jgi:transposase